MRLLWQQLQFKMVLLLIARIIVMHAWWGMGEGSDVFRAICLSLSFWSPLLMVLFLDAMKRQSRLFRLAMPVAYLVFVLAAYIFFGFLAGSTPIARQQGTNSTDPGTASYVMASFQGQISSSLSSIGFLMASFLYNAMYDRSGTAVHFPLPIVTIQRSTVGLILEAGTWMRTQVGRQGVELVPKRPAPVSAGGIGGTGSRDTDGADCSVIVMTVNGLTNVQDRQPP
jgi:hypothetical protein